MRIFMKENPDEMANSLSFIDMVNHALVTNFIFTNMYLIAIGENEIIAKIYEFTVFC